MTATEVSFHFAGMIEPGQMRTLSNLFSIYGIRRLELDESAHSVTIEYDATRLNNNAVAALLRRAGVALTAKIDKFQAPEPIAAAELVEK